MERKAAITVRRPIDEVRSAWREHFDDSQEVAFSEAPRNQGTEIRVPLEDDEHSELQVKLELRRFKQVAETGEVVRSDGSPEGITAARLVKQQPARPPAEVPGVVGVADGGKES